VTANLLYERVNKKITKEGYPDSKNVKAGAKAIKYHLDYMGWLLDQRRWLAGDAMTLADFAAAAHLSALDYISDVDWNRNANVREWYAKIKSRPRSGACSPTRCRASRRPRITPIWISEAPGAGGPSAPRTPPERIWRKMKRKRTSRRGSWRGRRPRASRGRA
jgi:hypothetical protein